MPHKFSVVLTMVAMVSWARLAAQPQDSAAYVDVVNNPNVTVSIETQLRALLQSTCPIAFFTDRPITGNVSQPVVANVTLQPMKFMGIYDTSQEFAIIASIWLTWNLPPCASWMDDPRFNEIQFIVANDRNSNTPIWHPRVWLANSATDHLFITDYDPTQQMYYLNSDGTMALYPMGLYTAVCDLSSGIYMFPFDTQTCQLGIEDFDDSRFSIIVDQGIAIPDQVTWANFATWSNGADVWEFLSNYSTFKWVISGGTPSAHVDYHFVFRRKPASYVLAIIIPSVCLIALQLMAFVLPPKHAERVIFSVTLLLSQYVLIGNLSQQIPQISSSILILTHESFQLIITSVLSSYFLLSAALASTDKWSGVVTARCVRVVLGEHLTMVRFLDIIVGISSFVTVLIEHFIVYGILLSSAQAVQYESAYISGHHDNYISECTTTIGGLVVPIICGGGLWQYS